MLYLLLAGLLFFLAAVFVLYIPGVQSYVKDKIERYVSESTGMDFSVKKVSLKFPFDLCVEHVYLGNGSRDTLLAADALQLDMALGGLLQGRVGIDKLRLENAVLRTMDSLAGMNVAARDVCLQVDQVDFKTQVVHVSLFRLEGGCVDLRVAEVQQDSTQTVTTPLKWILYLDRGELMDIDYRMEGSATGELTAGVKKAVIDSGRVSLGDQAVDIASMNVDGGRCQMLTVEGGVKVDDEDVVDTTASLPWLIRVKHLCLKDGSFYMRERNAAPDTLDFPAVLDFSRLSLELDSVYNRGLEMSAIVRHAGFRETDGMELQDLSARVMLENERMEISALSLQTPCSRLQVELVAESGLAGFTGTTPLRLSWNGQIGGRELLPFIKSMDKEMIGWLCQQEFPVRGRIEGSVDQLGVTDFSLNLNDDMSLHLNGIVSGVEDWEKAEGYLDLSVFVQDSRSLKFLTGNSFDIPAGMMLDSRLELREQKADLQLKVLPPGGSLDLQAHYDLRREAYRLEANIRHVALNAFMPEDSLGILSARLKFEGAGFDWERDRSDVSVDLSNLEYKGVAYRDIVLRACLDRGNISGKLYSGNEALDLDVEWKGCVAGNEYRGQVDADLRRLDLQALRFSPTPLAFAMDMNMSGDWEQSGNALFQADLKNISFYDGNEYDLGGLSLHFSSGKEQTRLDVDAGDLGVRFTENGNIYSLVETWTSVVDSVVGQFRRLAFDMEAVRHMLPDFSVAIVAGEKNPVGVYLRGNNFSFKKFVLNSGFSSEKDLYFHSSVSGMGMGEMFVDSVQVDMGRKRKALRYGVDVSVSSGQLGAVQFGIMGDIVDNQVNIRLKEKSEDRDEILNIGANVAFEEEAMTFSLSPDPLVIGYTPWRVNRGNYIRLIKGGVVAASLQLLSGDKRVRIVSEGEERDNPESLVVDIKGIELGGISEAISFLPEISGRLETDIQLKRNEQNMRVSGTLNLEELCYVKKRLGNVMLDMDYRQDDTRVQHVDARLLVDERDLVHVEGVVMERDSNTMMDMSIEIPGLPLELANVFVPEGTVELGGNLWGKLLLTGGMGTPRLNGDLAFKGGHLKACMIGTAYSLDSIPVHIEDNILRFARWGIIAPNSRRLELMGSVDFTSFDDILLDASLSTRGFQFIAAKQEKESLVFGNAYLDMAASLKGRLNALQVRGNMGLLENSEINYVLQSSPLDVTDKTQELVRFVSFGDTARVKLVDTLQQLDMTTLDLLMTLNIDPSVRMNVLLSSSGKNRVALQGGGELTYSLNPLGDSRLVGRYVLSGGKISYGLPVIGQKEFKIQDGNYVEWTGDLMNPVMNIVAAESISANVTDDSQNSRVVNFQAMIKVDGSLEKPEVSFDLSATGDLTIQNQLAGMTPEERSKEAMNLMIYGTYTAPGTVAKSNMSDNAINNLVENELNQWSRKHLKGVDLSFGINSYNQVTEGGESKKTDYSYQFSKRLFNNKVRVSVGGRVSTDNNPTEAGRMEENLVDDISLEYMFGNSSRYFLKIFRHTGYESVLEGEVTQTGISIVLRKKFQQFLDLFRWRKNRQMNKKDSDEIPGK